jgi:hypothetical protein
MVTSVKGAEENTMCSQGECKGYEEGICNYYGVEIPYNTIQLIGKPKDKDHAQRLKDRLRSIADGMRAGEKSLMGIKK